MNTFKIIEVKESIFANNDAEAEKLRGRLKEEKTFLMNLMSSPGSGKTTILMRTIEALKEELRIGVMEADIDSDVDAAKIATTGVKSIQLHTGGMCHLDAAMTEQEINELGCEDLDLVVLEKVGEFAHMRNPNLKIFPISAKIGEGMEEWCSWLKEQVAQWKA